LTGPPGADTISDGRVSQQNFDGEPEMRTTTGKKRGRPRDAGLPARRRDQIIGVATRVFAERGYASTDLQVIADRLAVGKGTLYRYFPSKRELFLACVGAGMQRLGAAVDAAARPVGDLIEKLGAAFRASVRFFEDEPDMVELLVQERAALGDDRKRSVFFDYREATKETWQAIFRRLIADGRVRPLDPAAVTEAIADLLYGMVFTVRFAGPRKRADARARDMLGIVLHGILTERERRAGAPGSLLLPAERPARARGR
jgi:AcrR family transcriptional regulator